MGEGATKIFSHQNLKDIDSATNRTRIGNWVIMEGGDGDDIQDSESMESSYEDSANSVESSSSSSSELMEDASSSSTSYSSPSSSSSHSNGPLYELSELMSQLPIKRGLSKHYQGKSQSYTSLASVKSLDDLAKKEKPYTQRIKSCKSYAGGLDGHKFYTPKATITKKTSRGSFTSLLGSSRGTLMTICKPPTSAQKNF